MPTNWDEFEQYYDPANTRKPKAATKDPWWKKWLDAANAPWVGQHDWLTDKPFVPVEGAYYSLGEGISGPEEQYYPGAPTTPPSSFWKRYRPYGSAALGDFFDPSDPAGSPYRHKWAPWHKAATPYPDYSKLPPGYGYDAFDPYDPAGTPYRQPSWVKDDTDTGSGGGYGYPDYPSYSYPSEPDRWYENMLYWDI